MTDEERLEGIQHHIWIALADMIHMEEPYHTLPLMSILQIAQGEARVLKAKLEEMELLQYKDEQVSSDNQTKVLTI